uniref:Uncharacterized protein B11B22.040 n=1 Tax=Neurospora crassa TaxID=5141 RepID=Q9P4Y8_NEUCS|nr:hypothetical protein [Neurospora crassa]
MAAIHNTHSLNCKGRAASVPVVSMIQVPSLGSVYPLKLLLELEDIVRLEDANIAANHPRRFVLHQRNERTNADCKVLDNRFCHKPFPSPNLNLNLDLNLNLNLNLDNNLYPNHPPLDQNSRSPTVIAPRVPTTSSIAAHPVEYLSNSYHSVIPHSSRPPTASNRLKSHVASTSKITP